MKSRYDIKTWAAETGLGRRIFNYNFRIKSSDVKEWRLLKAVPMHKDSLFAETTYVVQGKEAPGHLVRVNVTELADWRAAQKHLTEILDHNMRPDLPGSIVGLGDISFVTRAPQSDIPAAIQFTRGNIAVAVNSVGSVTIDVSSVATTIDRLLGDPTAKLPSVRRLTTAQPPKTVVAKGREGSTLVKDLKNVGNAWLKVIVPDGELRRKENTIVYVSRQGKKAVHIYSIK